MTDIVGAARIVIKPDTGDFEGQLSGQLSRAGQTAGSALNRNLASAAQVTGQLGSTLTKSVTLPIVGIGVAAAKLATDFQTSMTQITTLVGIPREEVAKFEEQIKQLGPAVGKAPQELGEALFFVTSAGLRGAEAMEALKASAQASALGLGETKTVADAVTSAVNAYGSGTLSATRATEILTGAVRQGKLEAGSLAPVLGKVLPTASALGISFENVAGTLAVFSRTGVDAAQGTTQLNAIMSGLLSTSPKVTKTLEAVGLSQEGLRKVAAGPGGLIEVMRILDAAFDGNVETMRGAFPELEAFRGVMNALAQDAGVVDEVMAGVADTTGILEEGMEEVSKTAGFQFAQAMAAAKSALIGFGDIIAPVLAGLARSAARFIQVFGDLPASMKTLLIVVGAAVAAIGPLLVIFSKVVLAGLQLQKLFLLLGGGAKVLSLLRIGLAGLTGPIGLIAVGLGILFATNDEFRESVLRLLDALVGALGPALVSVADVLGVLLGALTPVITVLGNVVAAVLTPFANALAFIVENTGPLVPVLLGVAVAFKVLSGATALATGGILTNTAAMAANAVTATSRVVASIGAQIVAWIALGTQALLAAARVALAWIIALGPIAIIIAAVIGLTVLIVKNWDTIKEVTLRVFGAIAEFFSGLWEGIKNVFSAAISGIIDVFTRFGPTILALVLPFIGIPLLIRQHWDTIKDFLAGVWNFLQEAASRVFGFLTTLFLNFTPIGLIIQHWETIRSFLGGVWETIRNLAASAFERMRQVIFGAIEAVVGLVSSIPGRVVGALVNAGQALVQAGRNLIQGLINGIRGMAGRLRDALLGLLPGPLRRFAGALGLGSPSKLFRGFGENLIEGLILGIEDEKQRLIRTMERLARDVGEVSVDALTIPAPDIAAAAFPTFEVGRRRVQVEVQGVAAGAGRAAGVVQNITVNEVAEDPVATAKRIAFELGTRSTR